MTEGMLDEVSRTPFLPLATQTFHHIISESLLNLLKNIALDYNIDYEELKTKYYCDQNALKKRRGRKKKIKDEYIETEEYIYDGKTYLVDSNNIVYTNNAKNPVMIGKRLPDGSIYLYS
jgi:hypothetical protein